MCICLRCQALQPADLWETKSPLWGSASNHPHSLLSVLSPLPGTSARGPLGNQIPLVGGVPATIPILFFLSCLRCQALQPVDLWETKSPLWGECQQPSPFSSFCPVSAARHFSPWTSGKPSPPCGGSASNHPHSLLSVLFPLPGTSAHGPLGNQIPLVGGVPATIPILFFLSCLRCQALQPVDLWETKSSLWGECQEPSPFSSFCPVSAARHFSLGDQVPLVGAPQC